ncbi:MAG: DUF1801 domain-containing protein [Erysipelotrichales bacterium]|nr:MAG: DUF1801 domain-containing protein [Erysipelotrichales bacterium]
MKSDALTVEDYIAALPSDRQIVVNQLRRIILTRLPPGFLEMMDYGMIAYVVPLSRYPKGYRRNPKVPLPFLNLANQKKYVSLYHMGLYADTTLNAWFKEAYRSEVGKAPDLGKACLRLNPAQEIPYDLIGDLVSKITVEAWIAMVESVHTTPR